jgi:hypothetical protein
MSAQTGSYLQTSGERSHVSTFNSVNCRTGRKLTQRSGLMGISQASFCIANQPVRVQFANSEEKCVNVTNKRSIGVPVLTSYESP